MKYDPPSFSKIVHAPTPAPDLGGNTTAPPGPARRAKSLVITTAAATGVDGTTITTQPVVEVRNQLNQLISAATDTVTVAVRDGTGTLIGTTALAAVAGVATWTDLELDSTDGTQVTLIYTAVGAYPAIGQVGVAIGVGADNKLAIQRQPVGAASGNVLSVQPIIQILDVDGRLTASTAVVTVAKASGTGTLSGTLTATAVAGVATFTNLVMTTPGTCTLVFTSPALTSVTSVTVTTV